MLSSQEQQVWDDVQRFWAEEAEEPPLPVPSDRLGRGGAVRDEGILPLAVVAGVWITIALVLFGVMAVAGLAVGGRHRARVGAVAPQGSAAPRGAARTARRTLRRRR